MQEQPTPKGRTVQWGVLCIAAAIVSFFRGNYLFGVTAGVVYASVAVGLVWLLARTLRSAGSVSVWRVRFLTLFALLVLFAMGFPALINEEVQRDVDVQATDRQARAELSEVFASDPAYADLSVSSVHLKAICITVHGSVNTRTDFDQLRSRVTGACPTLGKCWLVWDVTLRDTGGRIDGSDQELFPDAEPGEPASPVVLRSPS